MNNPIGTVSQLRHLGLVPLGDADGYAVTMARDEGQYDAFRIRVKVPNNGLPTLRINGVKSDATDVVRAVREFLSVVRA